MRPSPQEKQYWLDQHKNVTLLWRLLVIACVLILLAEFVVHLHPHFEFENWVGFYGWYGFVSYVSIVLTAKQFRKLVKRPPTYYESEDAQ